MFSHYLSKMIEIGVIDRLRHKYLVDNNIYTSTSNTIKDQEGLGYENVMFPFLALLTGLGVALLQLVIECVASKCSFDQQHHLKDNTPEDAEEIIDDIHELLLKNHGKLGGIKFLSRIRVLSTLPDSCP